MSQKLSPLHAGRIVYLHGFASNFNPQKQKARALGRVLPVSGVTVDYTRYPKEIFDRFCELLMPDPAALIIGTSLGGFFAAWLGAELDLPFIAINPAIKPMSTLQRYIGAGNTYSGSQFYLSRDVVDAYARLPFRMDGTGVRR